MTADADLAALYQGSLRDLAASVRNDRRLVSADASVTRTSRTCGSSITLDVQWQGYSISALGWRTRACTLGMASTAIIVQHAVGETCAGVGENAHLLRRLLAGENVTFPDPWGDLAMFTAARVFPSRFGSIMLPFEALSGACAERTYRTLPDSPR